MMSHDVTSFVSTIICFHRALGLLASKMTLTPSDSSPSPAPLEAVSTLLTQLLKCLTTNLALYRMVSVLVVYHWKGCPPHALQTPLLSALTDTSGLEDILPYIHNLQKDCQVSSCNFKIQCYIVSS